MTSAADTDPSAPHDVLVPAGRPIGEAAAWVGSACWAELRFHQVLTTWLAVEADGEHTQTWWAIRANRAELAEIWHRRLPELRELPRSGFVAPSAGAVVDVFAQADALRDDASSTDRLACAARILAGLADGYRGRVGVAVGPADGPTAASLARAIEVTEADLARLGVEPDDPGPALP